MQSPSIGEHYRPADADRPSGVYRVVGTGDGTVTLLRVGDADGQRVHSGEVATVPVDAFAGFGPAPNPDGNRPVGVAVASRLAMGYWSVRAFGQQLARAPLPALVAGALLAVGALGEGVLPVPEVLLTGAVVVGTLGLVYVGSGRW